MNQPFPTSWLRPAAALLAALVLLCASAPGAEKAVNIRLGTLAPRGTSYHKSLLTMRDKWQQASAGGVKLTVFPDGTQGGEADMVGLMQTGNLDAGLLTSSGLAEIEPAVTALQSMPMAFNTLDEVDYVGDKLRVPLEQKLAAKGYLVLFWTDSGWIRFFSKTPVVRPDDLRKLKLFTWNGKILEADLWKRAGFHPVQLETAGIPQGLLSDTINAVPMPPFFALAGNLDHQAKYMLNLNWAPLVGALVVTKKSWDKVPANTRAALVKAASEAGREVKSRARAENEESVAAMAKRGLKVQKVPAELALEWRKVIEDVQDDIRGKIVPADMFDEAQRALREFRAGTGAQ